ncbi:MAG TPA: hypothetical protein VF444_20920 [Pseudonocardiaceae bacterium]
MNSRVMPVGTMTIDQVRAVLASADFAPSAHNSQPWKLRCTSRGIELYADLDRALPVIDPNNQELLLACGAAIFTLKLAIRAQGLRCDLRLLPSPKHPDLLATLQPIGAHPITAEERALADAVEHRHACRQPFAARPVSIGVRNQLRRAAELEQAWLATLQGPQLAALPPLLRTAHHAQFGSPAFVAEWRHWVTRAAAVGDGARAVDIGWRSEPHPAGVTAGPGRDAESEPLTMVIGSSEDSRLSWLRAGQAMQRVLLTATAAGLTASFLAQLIEVPSTRADLRVLLGGGVWPQAVLTLGYPTMVQGTTALPIDAAITRAPTEQPSSAGQELSNDQRSSTGTKFRSVGPT